MTLKPVRSVLLATFAIAIAVFGPPAANADDAKQAAIAAALNDAPTTLEQGLRASEKEGKPISAKFEIEDGKLRISVYTMGGTEFREVIVSPDNGTVQAAEKITDGDDLKDAESQRGAMAKAKLTLAAAVEQAVAQNAGARAVSIIPQSMDYGQPVATVTLMRDGTFKTFAVKLN
jgi:hypothetical protein